MEKFITAVEPFAIVVVILAGASMTKWVTFSNGYVVGVATVFCGILLMLKHIFLQTKRG